MPCGGETVEAEQGGDLGLVTDFVEEDVPEDFAGRGSDAELSDVESLGGIVIFEGGEAVCEGLATLSTEAEEGGEVGGVDGGLGGKG